MADPKDKDKMVDYPEYNPNERVPFPPGAGPTDELPDPPTPGQEAKKEKGDYYQEYSPKSETTDTYQTTPGAPNLADPATRLSDEEAKKLNPDVDLDKNYKNP